MKTLYESILDLDDEEQTKKRLDKLVAPTIMLEAFRKVFGRLERNKNIISNSYLGSISETSIPRVNISTADKVTLKKIGEFKKELKKVGFECKVMKRKDSSYANIVFITWNMIIEYHNTATHSKEFYGLGIIIDGYNSNKVEVEEIKVTSASDEIIKAAESIKLCESILDDDDKIKDRIDNNLLPSVIVDKLKQYFNKYLERQSDIKRVGQWYPLGEVDDDLYDKESIKNTEKFMINAIKHMHLDIKRVVPHTLINVDPDWKEKFGDTYIKRYVVVLKNSGEEYMFEFTIHAKQYTVAKLEQIESIAIWTKSKEIAEMI